MRPRIRTLKPDFWEDRRIIGLPRDARLTAVALISAADDRGRLEHSPPAIRLYAFPRDRLTDKRVGGWIREVVRSGFCLAYEHDGWPYLWLPKFWRHQVINKPTESQLPPHPDDPYGDLSIAEAFAQFRDDARSEAGSDSGSPTVGLRASRARGRPFPSLPGSSSTENDKGQRDSAAGRRGVDQSKPPENLPAELLPTLGEVLTLLRGAWEIRGGIEPQERGVGLSVLRNPRADHVSVAHKLQHWLLAGRGQSASCSDIAKRFGDWCADEPAAKPQTAASGLEPAYDRRRAERAEALRKRIAETGVGL